MPLPIRHLLELIRFSHTLFALPFALLSAAMAWTPGTGGEAAFRWQDLLGILVCMATARGAAMAFNRIVDRRLDALNPRTQARHLPAGVLSVQAAWIFTVVSGLGFFAGTLLFLPRNPIPLAASVPVLAFLLAYSYTKRFTLLSHFWLGAALMLAPLAAWVAIRAEPFAWPPVLLGLAVLLWVAGFDILYACQDVAFDRKSRLHSVPVAFGVAGALRIAALCHLGTVAMLLGVPFVFPPFGPIYFTGVGLIGLLLVYEHSLVKPDDLRRVNQAFFHVNAVVSLGLLAVGLVDLYW